MNKPVKQRHNLGCWCCGLWLCDNQPWWLDAARPWMMSPPPPFMVSSSFTPLQLMSFLFTTLPLMCKICAKPTVVGNEAKGANWDHLKKTQLCCDVRPTPPPQLQWFPPPPKPCQSTSHLMHCKSAACRRPHETTEMLWSCQWRLLIFSWTEVVSFKPGHWKISLWPHLPHQGKGVGGDLKSY